MKRKIIISFFLVIFIASTTGLPFTVTFCTLGKDVPLSDMCPMCSMERGRLDLCSAKELTNSSTNTSKIKSICCEQKTFDYSVKDKFVSSSTESEKVIQLFVLSDVNLNPQEILLIQNPVKFLCGKSPPLFENNHIYKDNSVFLI